MKPAETISGKELEVVPRLLGPVVARTEVCSRCQMRGRHASELECIDALRDELGRLELAEERLCEKLAIRPPRAKRQPPRSARWVILDGERLTLTSAAHRLGIDPSTLHRRLRDCTQEPSARDIDIRAVGADVAKRGAGRVAPQESPAESQREVADGRVS